MIDIHTHIMFDLDDGSRSLEESIFILKEAEAAGITDIILTPHYIKDSIYCVKNKEKKENYKTLKNILEKEDIDINLYLGNEIYIDSDIEKLLEKKEVFSLNNSRYLLIELPLFGAINNIREVMFELMLKGYQPIIAHPERNEMFQKNDALFLELYNQGVLFQANMGSFLGMYGKTAKKTVKRMIKNNKIHFLATDVHHKETIFKDFPKKMKKIKKMTKGKYELLTKINPNNILQNKDI